MLWNIFYEILRLFWRVSKNHVFRSFYVIHENKLKKMTTRSKSKHLGTGPKHLDKARGQRFCTSLFLVKKVPFWTQNRFFFFIGLSPRTLLRIEDWKCSLELHVYTLIWSLKCCSLIFGLKGSLKMVFLVEKAWIFECVAREGVEREKTVAWGLFLNWEMVRKRLEISGWGWKWCFCVVFFFFFWP